MNVIIINDDNLNAPSESQFQHWVCLVEKNIPEKFPVDCNEVCIAIINATESAKLNEQFRHKKGPTNVLSFHYDDISCESLGDLAICPLLVEREAAEQNKSLESHWAHLTIHGILHLLGFDHINDDEALIMESLEIKLLHQLGFENPYV